MGHLMNDKTDLSRLAAEIVRAQDASLATQSSLGRVKARLSPGHPTRKPLASMWWLALGAALSASTVWALVAPRWPRTIAKTTTPSLESIDAVQVPPKSYAPAQEPIANKLPVGQPEARAHRHPVAQSKPHHTAVTTARTPKADDVPPPSADALLDAADRARAQGDSGAAVDALTEFVTRFPKDPRLAVAWFTLGRVLGTLGRHPEAASAYAACMAASRSGPLREDAAAATALAWADAGDVERARHAAAQYLRLYPHGAFLGRIAPLLQP